MLCDSELTIAQIIKKYNLFENRNRAKSLGQHFLCDASLLNKIVKLALPFNDCDIIEIGPGPCGLTREIIKYIGNNNLYCIEKDLRLKELHNNLLADTQKPVNFIYEDALKIKLQDLTKKQVIVISNLPYNVGTQIFLNLLKDLSRISKMVLMFQKEVADRICANINTKAYGRLSVISQLLCNVERLFNVSNTAFFPPPKVMSTVIKVTPKHNIIPGLAQLEKLTERCFQTRRKTIYSILCKIIQKEKVEEILGAYQIDKMSRPENISPEMFLTLSKVIYETEF